MHSSVLTTVLLPIALAVIMLGLGLSLAFADFARVIGAPRAVGTALACQLVLMPALCLALLALTGADPDTAVGMLLLAASPGGTLAAVYSHLARGDIALNITLTAVNSLISVVTLPLVMWGVTRHYVGHAHNIGLQPQGVVTLIATVVLPVALGMALRRLRPGLARTLGQAVRIVSLIVLVVVVVGAILQNAEQLGRSLGSVLPLTAAFSVLNLVIGYWVPRLARVERPQAVASSMEIGIHNGALAVTIALSPALLNMPGAAVTPAIYSLVAFITAAVAASLLARRSRTLPVMEPASST
ncbi:bile acid:sodium symporter family protein [Streptomyces sp. NPDC050743]|uniref:bile acid:sodium symporter family protein n=1 Tax=Streptomyces sp. NPDC050743 TaxID=3365634 RepID=UPI0037BBF2A7